MAKSIIKKEFEKQTKENKKQIEEAAIRSQAQGIIICRRKEFCSK